MAVKSIILFSVVLILPGSVLAGQSGPLAAAPGVSAAVARTNSVAPPVVTEKYEYYDVRGACEKDLKSQLKRCGVIWTDGKRYDSVTSWHIDWHYGYSRGPGRCAADSFRVAVDILFRYPRWARPAGAPRPLADLWDGYLNRLELHEKGHRDLAVAAAEGLTRAVSGLPPCATCGELDREVRDLCRRRMDRLAVDEEEYDRTTAHGRTQGAVFP